VHFSSDQDIVQMESLLTFFPHSSVISLKVSCYCLQHFSISETEKSAASNFR